MSRRLKTKIYKTMIRPVMVYGAETRALKKTEERKLERTEMRMLRWIMGTSLRDHLGNEEVRGRAGVECITEVIRKAKLRWSVHLVRRDDEELIKRARRKPVEGRRSRGRLRVRWRDGLVVELQKMGVMEEDAMDRNN